MRSRVVELMQTWAVRTVAASFEVVPMRVISYSMAYEFSVSSDAVNLTRTLSPQ